MREWQLLSVSRENSRQLAVISYSSAIIAKNKFNVLHVAPKIGHPAYSFSSGAVPSPGSATEKMDSSPADPEDPPLPRLPPSCKRKWSLNYERENEDELDPRMLSEALLCGYLVESTWLAVLFRYDQKSSQPSFQTLKLSTRSKGKKGEEPLSSKIATN